MKRIVNLPMVESFVYAFICLLTGAGLLDIGIRCFGSLFGLEVRGKKLEVMSWVQQLKGLDNGMLASRTDEV